MAAAPAARLHFQSDPCRCENGKQWLISNLRSSETAGDSALYDGGRAEMRLSGDQRAPPWDIGQLGSSQRLTMLKLLPQASAHVSNARF